MSVDPQKIAEEIAAGFHASNQFEPLEEVQVSAVGEIPDTLARHEQIFKLIEKGWQAFYAHYFGQRFVDSLAIHHQEAVE